MATDPSGLIAQLLSPGAINGAGIGFQQSQNNALDQQNTAQALAIRGQAAAAQIAKARQEAEQQQQYQTDVSSYFKKPTSDALAQLVAKYPDQADALKKSYDVMDAPARESRLTQFGQLYSAAGSGRADLAGAQLDKIIAAEQAQGIADQDAIDLRDRVKAADPDALTQLKAFSQVHLAAASPEFAKALGIGKDKDSTHVITAGGALVDDTGKELYRAADAPKYEKVANGDGSESIVQVGGGDPASGTRAAPGGSGAPLSVRLNNPGAIKYDPNNKWQGQIGVDHGFVHFDTPDNGARAHTKLIGNQIAKGFDTPLEWANHYAPASDNNDPVAYANTIAKGLGIGPNDKITPAMAPKIAALSAAVEAGGSPSNALVGASGTPRTSGMKVLYTSKPADAGADSATVEFYGQKVAAGGDLPPLGMGKQAAALRQAILARSAQIQMGKGMDGGDSNLLHADVKTATTALAGLERTRNSLNPYLQTFDGNVDQVRKLAPAGVGGSIPVFNRWIQAGRTSVSGDAAVTKLNVAINAVANENAKIMSGASGGAISSDSARHEAMSLINNAQTLPQLNAALDQMQTDTKIRMKSLDDRQASLRAKIGGHPEPSATASPRTAAPTGGRQIGTYHGKPVFQLPNGKRVVAQ